MSYVDRFRLVWTPLLKRRKNATFQAVAIVCPPSLGAGGKLTLYVGKHKYTTNITELISDPKEWGVYYLLVRRPGKPIFCRAVWETPLKRIYRDTLKLKPVETCTVHIVFKTHFDAGYTHRFDEVIRLYQTRHMSALLDCLERTAHRKAGRRVVWTFPTWLLERCLDPKAVTHNHLKKLEHYIRNGQVVWGLMPFTTHSEFFGLEEMCRSLYGARRLAERFNVPVPAAAKMTDVPAHTASLAMAFAAAGGKFFQIGTNPYSLPPAVPPLFWWKLPDGNELLCHYHQAYGTPLLPPPEWPWREWLSVQVTDDNLGPGNLELLERIDWIEENFDSPTCRIGRLENFAAAVIRRHGSELPEVDKEFVDWWIPGIASQARTTALARWNKDRLPSVEILQTLAGWSSDQPISDKLRGEIGNAYQQLALYTEHTWGDRADDARLALPRGNRYTSAVFTGKTLIPPIDRWVASWNDKAGWAVQANKTIEGIESAALSSFAAQTARNKLDLRIVLFNTLNWSRGGLVRMQDRKLPKDDFELVDPTTGGTVLYERRNGWIEFIAPLVPSCGYLALNIQPVTRRSRPGLYADWDPQHPALHTSEYTLQFDKAGGITRWHDRARSCQWCSDEVEFPLGAYLYEMPGSERLREFARQVHTNFNEHIVKSFHRPEYDNMTQFGPVPGGPAKIRPEITPLYARVSVEANCPTRKVPNRRSGDIRRYRTVFTNYRGRRDLHIKMRLMGKRATYAAEAGYAFFPFACKNPFVLIDRIAHLARPDKDFAEKVNVAHLAVHRGVRLEGEYAGMNFYPLHTPLIAFGRPGAYRFDDDGDYHTSIIYATLFNNCWGTNFAQWQSGDFSFDFVLCPSGNDDWDGGLAPGGAEVFRPLLAAVTDGWKNTPCGSLLKITPATVQLVTLKPAEFESGTIIRLFNTDVDPARAHLTFPQARRGDYLLICDLLERPKRRKISINGQGQAAITLKPNEIATLLLKPAKPVRA